MPHSSGGGSHSGGSHSSSHSSHHSSHSGGSSSGGGLPSNRHSSGQPFPGAKRYLYYRNNRPYFLYANYDVRKPDPMPRVAGFIVFFIILLPFIIASVFIIAKSVTVPKRLDSDKHPKFVIEDNIGVVEDKKQLKKSMQEFYDTTGIIPAVITVNNDDWNEDYTSLENYAYDLYVNNFKDENHWLIVYSEAVKDNGFNDWYWEGMQGNNTDPILTGKRSDSFTVSLHKRLLQRDTYSVDAAIALTLDEYRPQMMKPYANPAGCVGGLFMLVMFGFISWYIFAVAYKPAKVSEEFKNAQPCELTAVYEEPCNFCGGIFIVGMHTTCPHCGAALPAHHYIKDAQGNVVQIL